jgi:hypothetical protein
VLQKEHSPNPRAVAGDNSGQTEARQAENALECILRVCRAEYNAASQDKRYANEKMRECKNEFKESNASAYAAIDSIVRAAREELTGKLRELDGYEDAEEAKRDAALRAKAALKKLKDAGIDVQAFKIANKMAEMDAHEREEFFDAIDKHCKALRLWGADY